MAEPREVDGRWVQVISVTDPITRRRVRKRFYGKTKKEVKALAGEYEAQLRKGLSPDGSRRKAGDYLLRWAERQRTWSNKTRVRHEAIVKRLSEYLKDVRLEDLRVSHVQSVMAQERARGLSARSVNYAKRLLAQALKDAVAEGLVIRNVAKLVKGEPQKESEITALTPEEVNRLLRTIKGDPFEPLIKVALGTGMRQGEILGLRWADVDMEGRVVHVRRSLSHYGAGKFELKEPKTRAGLRDIPMLDMVYDAFSEQAMYESAWVAQGNESDLVFHNKGKYLRDWEVIRHFKHFLRAAQIPERRFHDLRHTFATIAREQGLGVHEVQGLLGHSKPSVTLDIYQHLYKDDLKDAVTKMSGAFE